MIGDEKHEIITIQNNAILLNKKLLKRKSDVSNTEERQTWGSNAEFILSLIGYAVSLANIWRFPYLCYRNGGGAFLIPYWLMLFVCGIPLFFLELVLGQFSGKSAIFVWDICPIFRGVGIGSLLITIISSPPYILLLGLILNFLFSSFSSPLPWSHCDNNWNSLSCIILKNYNKSVIYQNNNFANLSSTQNSYFRPNGTANLGHNFSLSNASSASSYEFFNSNILQITSGLHDMGHMNHKLLGFCALAWVIVYLCIVKGIKTTGKVVYFTASFPYFVLTILLCRSIFLPGAYDGILFLLKPDWSRLKEFKIWNEAATQIFFSLGPGWSGLITMASYNKFRNNCLRDSLIVSVVNCGTSLYAALVVFSVVGFMSHVLSLPIEKVATQGVGLAFIVYPEALLHLPIPNFWAIIFFLMLLTVGLDTMFVSMEIIFSAILSTLPRRLKRRRTLFIFVSTIIMALFGIPFAYQGGVYLFQLIDWYIAILAVMTFCFIEVVTVCWIYGSDRFIKDIEFMLDRPIRFSSAIIILWKYVIPVLLIVALVFNIIFHVPVQYNSYVYPKWATNIGWLISSLGIIPIPLFAAYHVYKAKGNCLKQKLINSFKPCSWEPSSEPYKTQYNNAKLEN